MTQDWHKMGTDGCLTGPNAVPQPANEPLSGQCLSPSPSFATLITSTGPPKILVKPTQESEIGRHDMVFRVTLPNYDVTFTESFLIDITKCTIHSLTVDHPDPDAYTYHIDAHTSPLLIPFPTHHYSHSNCPDGDYNGLTFTITDYPWATIRDPSLIAIQEDDVSKEGVYPLTWTVCPAPSSV